MAALCGAPAATLAPPTVAQVSPTSIADTSTPPAAATTAATAPVATVAAARPTAVLTVTPTAEATVAPSTVAATVAPPPQPDVLRVAVPFLATALTHSADGVTWTATLRAGVRFHDGTALSATAVKQTLEAVMENTEIAKFKDNPAFTLFAAPTFQTVQLVLNTQRPPLDDKKVRQAIAAAIDADAIMAKMLEADGLPVYPLHGPLPDGLYPASPDVPANHFDLAMAKQLLVDAGHPGGGFKLRLIYYDSDRPDSFLMPLVVQDLAQIGISVDAQPLTGADFVGQIRSSKLGDQPDVVSASTQIFRLDGSIEILRPGYHSSSQTGLNFAHYNNPVYDQLVDSAIAQEVANPEAALAQYVQAQKLLVDDGPAVFLFRPGANFVLPDYLKGFAYNPNYSYGVDFYAMYYSPAK